MGAKIDFIFSKNGMNIPIEAKYQKFSPHKLSLPTGLKSFIAAYHPRRAVVVNNNLSEKKQINKTLVEFIPFYFFSKIYCINH